MAAPVPRRRADRIERVLRRPLVAWLPAVGILWLWHLPALYEAALEHPACMSGSIYRSWSRPRSSGGRCLTPVRERRLALSTRPGPYLLTAAAANTLLGILLTFAPAGLYPAYRHPLDLSGSCYLCFGTPGG